MEYRLAHTSELSTMASLFAKSFQNYPLFCAIFEKEAQRRHFLHTLHQINTKAFACRHLCVVGIKNHKILSAAIIQQSNRPSVNLWEYIKCGAFKLFKSATLQQLLDFLNLMEEIDHINQHNTSTWYLEALAVDCAHQGKQLGSDMLNKGIRTLISERGGGELTLLTHTLGNYNFYTKNAFRQDDSSIIKFRDKVIKNWRFSTIIPNRT